MANKVQVDQRLPFDFCSECDKFEPVTDVQQFYADGKIAHRAVILECRNDWLCRQLKDNMDDLLGGDSD